MREREMAQMLKQAEQIKVDEQRMLDAKKVRATAMIAEVEDANQSRLDGFARTCRRRCKAKDCANE